jgi:dipeptidyl aminopeptidase/acylaminoacyl peptidase
MKTKPMARFSVSGALFLAALWGFFLPPNPSFAAAAPTASLAAPEEKNLERAVPAWLTLGPFERALPAFADDQKYGFGPTDLLEFDEFEASAVRPKPGLPWQWTNGQQVAWKEVQGGEAGISLGSAGSQPKTAYLAAYVESFRYRKARFTVRTKQLHRVFFDGRQVAVQAQAEADGKTTADLKIETGVHLILIKTVYDPKTRTDWNVRASLEFAEIREEPEPQFSTSPREKVALRHILDGPQAAGISISPDGANLVLTMTQTLPPSDESESWIELYQIDSGKSGRSARLSQTFRGGTAVSEVVWAPQGKRFSYTTNDKNGGSIWLVDAASGETRPLLRNFKNLGSHVWTPDGTALVFSATEEGPKDSDLAKHFRNLEDRQPGQRDRRHLYRLTLPDGLREQLTAGEFSADFGGFSPDGKSLLFTRTVIDMTERPYSRTELYRLDLSTLKEDLVWKGPWFNEAQFSPDGKNLLVLGGPSAFGDIGVNVSPGKVPNDYDIQAYLFNLADRRAQPLTREFSPSIDRAFWAADGRVIRFLTTDGSWRRLYEYTLADKSFRLLEAGVDYIGPMDIAAKAPVAALIGSGPTTMPRVFLWDLERKEVRPLLQPEPEATPELAVGKVETWTFKNKRGVVIDGFVVYPPDFDPARKYPLIVNYYGGTTPIERSFGGRYPHALYAAHGYVVYVPEPSGAIGYGQEFSAYHVNDWGEIAGEEIIDGVTAFLAVHPFVDPKRVGCIGASYGGFMTMALTTKTSMFAAAISHAGISSIAGYWGVGYWGYTYSAVASADSFPWNRKDIYVDRSPLFNADKITTPLLLLNGAADTNVPPGESTQLFTALKVLGREVEFISFYGEDHRILTYNKRILFNKTILAWFDRWLKGQPEWWFDLYPQN